MYLDVVRLAKELLTKHNKNEELNSPQGLRGDFERFVKFNGGVSLHQLNWLSEVLKKAESDGELVIVAGLLNCHFLTVFVTSVLSPSVLTV
jgi:hypothetical protein